MTMEKTFCNKIIDVMQENGLDLKLLFNISIDGPNIINRSRN